MASATVVISSETNGTDMTTAVNTTKTTNPDFMKNIHTFNEYQEKCMKEYMEKFPNKSSEELWNELEKLFAEDHEKTLSSSDLNGSISVDKIALAFRIAQIIEKIDPEFDEFCYGTYMIMACWAKQTLVFADGTSYADFL